MGMFDFIKEAGAKIFGGDDPHKEPTAANKSISSHIRDHGLDPSPLKFFFNADGTVDVSGVVESQELREKLILIIGNVRGIAGVNDKIIVAAAVGDSPDLTASGSAEASGGAQAESAEEWTSRTYTVKSGDTLWKIASEMYGNGSKYPVIFEANKPMLSDPDKIYPGQVLRIPPLD
ncbi:MAG: peptidoglycan-binding protein LysM [Wenzhouxiangellaceae bacterium]